MQLGWIDPVFVLGYFLDDLVVEVAVGASAWLYHWDGNVLEASMYFAVNGYGCLFLKMIQQGVGNHLCQIFDLGFIF